MLLLPFDSDILCAIHNCYFKLIYKFHTQNTYPQLTTRNATNYRMASAKQRALTIASSVSAAAAADI